MTERDLLLVINPPAEQRNRPKENPSLPGHSAWRYATSIGALLNPSQQVVRSNHFTIDTKNIPGVICHYHVHLYRYKDNVLIDADCVADEDALTCLTIVTLLGKNHPDWGSRGPFVYDGRSALFTANALPLAAKNELGEPFVCEDVFMRNLDGSQSRKKYKISLTLINKVVMPSGGASDWAITADQGILRSVDTALLNFARADQLRDSPDWFVVGSKVFRSNGSSFPLGGAYVASRGYFAGLKACLAGLVLVCDMSVTAFLTGGPLIDVMATVANYNQTRQFLEDSRRPINPRVLAMITEGLKNCKLKVVHIGHSKKFKSLGPPADHKDSSFELDNGTKVTVAEYFFNMGKTNPQYRKHLGPDGRLKYPYLPTINVGSAKKAILIPAELCLVPGGQCRSQKVTGDMTAQLIRHAAVKPDERWQYITGEDSVVNVLRGDSTTGVFGINCISREPISCATKILPSPKIQYGAGATSEPGFRGEWRMERLKFARPPPNTDPKGIMYGVILVGEPRGPPPDQAIEEFCVQLETDSNTAGVKLRRGGPHMKSSGRPDELSKKMQQMKTGGARIVCVMMAIDCYNDIKLVADRAGIATQCLRWKNIERAPRGYHLNVMLKVNTKLGGTNHTLASRLAGPPPAGTRIFQDPPASLSWVFDKPCMLVGMDVSHAEPGSNRESMAAVVASMDGRACQYVAHISAQSPRLEILGQLEDIMKKLLECFQKRNGTLPAHIIVYRDGVGDGQFDQVLQQELPAIKGALALLGYQEDSVKISVIICQKRHHTRLVYEERDGSNLSYVNPCPGVLVDASTYGGLSSIVSGVYNEFYLNSHTAIQGTCKPCKYALIHDEIGFKMAELELLTYWTCYLYARCNRSVSLATPAYYAHWASRRAKNLFAAGATAEDLISISNTWSQDPRNCSMFFI